jgi:deoxyribose-phosphate aldolase
MDDVRAEINARKLVRRELSVADVGAHLEHRLYCLPPTPDAAERGCADAARDGFAAVICRPERVAEAAQHLAGTGIPVVTAVGWDVDDSVALDSTTMLAEAVALAAQGANEIALVASLARLEGAGTAFARQTATLVEAMATRDVRVRVILDTEQLGAEQITLACRRARDAGSRWCRAGLGVGSEPPSPNSR